MLMWPNSIHDSPKCPEKARASRCCTSCVGSSPLNSGMQRRFALSVKMPSPNAPGRRNAQLKALYPQFYTRNRLYRVPNRARQIVCSEDRRTTSCVGRNKMSIHKNTIITCTSCVSWSGSPDHSSSSDANSTFLVLDWRT
jgi:hypothetical protein